MTEISRKPNSKRVDKVKMKLQKVLIVGGTHGNEPTGMYLIKKWKRDIQLVTRNSFETSLFLANPKAAAVGQRYIDKDLNRCFLNANLENNTLTSFEELLAKEINRMFGPKSESGFDLIIDMHTTTTNMGITLICDDNQGTLKLVGEVQTKIPGSKIYCIERSERIQSCLRALAPHAIGIEIGAVPQNVLRHDILEKMANTVSAILDIAHKINIEPFNFSPLQTEIYLHLEDILYPEQKDCPDAVIHKDIEGKNFQEIEKNSPIFVGSDDRVIRYSGPDHACAVFINEPAYYEKRIAFSLTRKTVINSFKSGY